MAVLLCSSDTGHSRFHLRDSTRVMDAGRCQNTGAFLFIRFGRDVRLRDGPSVERSLHVVRSRVAFEQPPVR